MRRYETMFIIDPDLSDEGRGPVIERVKGLIESQDGFLVEMNEWGLRKLAYTIKKKPRGYYILLNYCGTGPLVNEMERFFRIDDRVLKFMTIVLDEDADIEKIKEEIAEAEAVKQVAAEAGKKVAEKAVKQVAEKAASEVAEPEKTQEQVSAQAETKENQGIQAS